MIEKVRSLINSNLDNLEIKNLSLEQVDHDFYTDSYNFFFSSNGRTAQVNLVREEIENLFDGNKFAWKHLRKALEEKLPPD